MGIPIILGFHSIRPLFLAPFASLMSDKRITHEYELVGNAFGDAVSYAPLMGECFGFSSLLRDWGVWEEWYAHRGFRTLPIDDFIESGGYGKNISELLGVEREEGEPGVLHARIYRDVWLGKVEPGLDMDALMSGELQSSHGIYYHPSTKNLE